MILITGWLLKPLPLVGQDAKLIKHNTKAQDYYQPLAWVNTNLSANTLIPVNHVHISQYWTDKSPVNNGSYCRNCSITITWVSNQRDITHHMHTALISTSEQDVALSVWLTTDIKTTQNKCNNLELITKQILISIDTLCENNRLRCANKNLPKTGIT